MNKKDMNSFEEMIQAMASLMNLKKDFESRHRGECGPGSETCDNCDDEDDEDEEDEGCPLLNELEDEYKAIILWAVGINDAPQCKKKARKHWIRMHPDMPMPRILKSDLALSPYMSTICLLIDVLPLYLQDKKKCAG